MTPPLVTIILPNYNHERFLNKRIDSIINQTYQNFEIILLDDNSTDNSKLILDDFSNNPKVSHYIVNETNSGSTFIQWRKSFELSKGEYIWIAESDDFCDAFFLEKAIRNFDDKELSLVYGKSFIVDEYDNTVEEYNYNNIGFDSNRWKHSYKVWGNEEIKNYLCIRNTIPNASAVVFKKALAINYIKNLVIYKSIGDWFFWINIIKDQNIMYDSSMINFFRCSTQSTRNHSDSNKYYYRHFEHYKLNLYLENENFITNNQYKLQRNTILFKLSKSKMLTRKLIDIIKFFKFQDALKLFYYRVKISLKKIF